MEYKHIIFDLDGTLIDTEAAVLKTWQCTLQEYHYEYTLEELRIVLGISLQKTLKQLKLVVDDQFEKRWMENYGRFAVTADFFEGAKEMLMELKKRGYSLGIVTSRSKDEYSAYFQKFHLEAVFDRIVLADDTEQHKPDPAPLYKYMELEQTEPSSCMYIGDMPTDIECANRAGITSGLVTWNGSGILCGEAQFIVRSPEELLQMLL